MVLIIGLNPMNKRQIIDMLGQVWKQLRNKTP